MFQRIELVVTIMTKLQHNRGQFVFTIAQIQKQPFIVVPQQLIPWLPSASTKRSNWGIWFLREPNKTVNYVTRR